MDSTIIVAIIGAIEGVGIAIIGVIVSRIDKKNQEYREMREQKEKQTQEELRKAYSIKEDFDAAKLDLLFATANAVDVLLQAAHGDHVNGNVEEARSSISAAKSECNHIINKQAAKI